MNDKKTFIGCSESDDGEAVKDCGLWGRAEEIKTKLRRAEFLGGLLSVGPVKRRVPGSCWEINLDNCPGVSCQRGIPHLKGLPPIGLQLIQSHFMASNCFRVADPGCLCLLQSDRSIYVCNRKTFFSLCGTVEGPCDSVLSFGLSLPSHQQNTINNTDQDKIDTLLVIQHVKA